MSFILGINAFHADSSACILNFGKLIAAAEEERFRRIKHWSGFPSESIKYCLNEAKISISEVSHITINTDPFANFAKKIIYSITNTPKFIFFKNRIKTHFERLNLLNEIRNIFPSKQLNFKIHRIEHHLSHLASSHLLSPFKNSVTISVDGFGDFSSGAWGIAMENKIKVYGRSFFPHSLGIFYQAMTQFIGFPNYGDEYKVMGLAPYGKDRFLNKMRSIVYLKKDGNYLLNLDLFSHHKKNMSFFLNKSSPNFLTLFNKNIEKYFGISFRKEDEPLKEVHYDLAYSTQAMYEEAFFNLLNSTHSKFGIDNLTLSGGCAMNSVANGKIYRKSPYKKIYVQPAAGDAGGAIGSAYVVANQLGFLKERQKMNHAYWGPSFNIDYNNKLLSDNQSKINKAGCIAEYIKSDDKLFNLTAEAISKGLVVGWFQGRMEWGPRALGNRSILADPRRVDMKNILNTKIKRRESFRPFAPSILREEVLEWFEEDDDVPFMTHVFQIKKNKRHLIPAVTHLDGSGRLQTVSLLTNDKFYKLILEFKKLTGVPIVLNTSFNENEPIVCRPEEALETFLRTKMDLLVLENWIIKRVIKI